MTGTTNLVGNYLGSLTFFHLIVNSYSQYYNLTWTTQKNVKLTQIYMTKGTDMTYMCQAPNSVSNNSSLCSNKLFSSLTPIIKSLNHDITVFKPPLKVYLLAYIFCAILNFLTCKRKIVSFLQHHKYIIIMHLSSYLKTSAIICIMPCYTSQV
jgi:hypothetical protein